VNPLSGSVALWYDSKGGELEPPAAELHFNLWRNPLLSGPNFFDIGIRFKRNEKRSDLANSVEAFHLFVPGVFRTDEIEDLSPLMEHGRTLTAVFSEVVSISETHDRCFKTTVNDLPHLTFHKIDIANDVSLKHIENSADSIGTIFSFKENFCKRVTDGGTDHYLRFRILIRGQNREIFTTDTTPSDWFILSTFYRNELTEFRFNERRSFPDSILPIKMKFFAISGVHYFLMRDINFDLIDAHTPFHKMRKLEVDLWKHYLRGRPPGSQSSWQLRKFLAVRRSRPILIYHWRVLATPEKKIEDFVALASFREPVNNLLLYAMAIGLVGALGNAVYYVSINLIHRAGVNVPADQISPIRANSLAIIGLLGLALCLPLMRALYRTTSRGLRHLYLWVSDRGR
jgi:hypothetical protein